MGAGAAKPTWRVTEAPGHADFGVLHPGDYAFRVFRAWDQNYLRADGEFSIEPGSQVKQRIICPKAPLDCLPVRIRAIWPADLENEKLSLYATFTFVSLQRDGRPWTLCDRTSGADTRRESLSTLVVQVAPGQPFRHLQFCVIGGPAPRMLPFYWTLAGGPPTRIWADILRKNSSDSRERAEPTEWQRGTYALSGAVVLRPEQLGGGAGSQRFEVLFMHRSRNLNPIMGTAYLRRINPLCSTASAALAQKKR